MPDTVVELGKVDWKRIFPWVRLFRVFRTAIDLRMLTLSCVALVALSAGDWIFTSLPFAAAAKSSPESGVAYTWHRPPADNPLDLPAKVVHNPWGALVGVALGASSAVAIAAAVCAFVFQMSLLQAWPEVVSSRVHGRLPARGRLAN